MTGSVGCADDRNARVRSAWCPRLGGTRVRRGGMALGGSASNAGKDGLMEDWVGRGCRG